MSIEETEQITSNFNIKAMEYLESNNFNGALSLLHQANYLLKNKKLTDSIIRLKCITLNNLGCIYKRLEKPKKALLYLHEALSLALRFSSKIDMAGIHLNICAINSNLSSHEEALFHALKGLKIAQNDFDLKNINSVTTLLSGYYQTAFEYIYLHKSNEALKYLKYGYELSCTHLGKNHITTYKFFKALHDKSLKDMSSQYIKDLKYKQNIKTMLKPINFKLKGVHKPNRSEVKSTEPLNMYKIKQKNHSYSSSPLKKVLEKPKDSNKSSKVSFVTNNSPLAHNITYIGNVFNVMQKRLDKFSDKFVNVERIKSVTESIASTPREIGLKRFVAAIKIQKNLKMWKSRKKYQNLLKSIIKIQRAVRSWRYNKFLIREKHKISNFSQQFNKKILEEHKKYVQSQMVSDSIQTSLDISEKNINIGCFPLVKKIKIYDIIVLIQKNIRKFLMKNKIKTIKKGIIDVQKGIRMILQRKKFLDHRRKILLLKKKNLATIILQKNWKMIRQLRTFKKIIKRIKFLQMFVRSFLSKKVAVKENILENAVIKSKREWD